MRTFLLLALTSALVGCASAPTTPTEPSTAPAAQAPQAAPAPAVSDRPADAAKSTATDEGEWRPPAGYKTRVENGQTVYCKKVTVLGSRFPKDVCMTESQVRDHESSNDNIRRDKDQASRVCTMGGCGSN